MTGALTGGVFRAKSRSETTELHQLVDDIGRKSFEARLGSRCLPEVFDKSLWSDLSQAGLTRLTSSSDPDAGPAELAVVLRGIARHCGAVPIAETDLLAGWLAGQAGLCTPSGPLTLAWTRQVDVCTGGRISVDAVPWSQSAAAVVIAVEQFGELLVACLAPDEFSYVPHENLAGEPRDAITVCIPADRFRSLPVAYADELAWRGAWARCVQIVGALDAAAEMSVAYTGEREQFGRPLSAFQAVQHGLAHMAGEIERLRAITEVAVAAAADSGFTTPHARAAISAAKVVGADVVASVCATAHQLHGAIGTTMEHPLWLATTRAQSWIDEFGTRVSHAARLTQLLRHADQTWDLVVGLMPRIDKSS
jgi:acyl-CoA dehydrogenase